MRLWVVLCALALASSCFAHPVGRPDRVVLIVIDQMRADLPDRFPMPNVRRLMREGTRFPDAIVGHLASETVVSHLVMAKQWATATLMGTATGLAPRLKMRRQESVLQTRSPPLHECLS